jgi:hypothetical protein
MRLSVPPIRQRSELESGAIELRLVPHDGRGSAAIA